MRAVVASRLPGDERRPEQKEADHHGPETASLMSANAKPGDDALA
jgi:hypothetical protein